MKVTSVPHGHWHERANTAPTPYARQQLRHGRVLRRLGSLVVRWDMPDEVSLPDDRPILFAGNHRSYFDVVASLAAFAHLGLSSRILVRADLFDMPVVGRWLHHIGCIPTSRTTRVSAQRAALDALSAGTTVAIMPEGRLVPPMERPGGVGRGRPGVVLIAARADAAVVPVAFHGTDDVWPRGRALPRLPFRGRPTVRIRIGEPLELRGDRPKAEVDRLMATIAAMLAEMAPSADADPPVERP